MNTFLTQLLRVRRSAVAFLALVSLGAVVAGCGTVSSSQPAPVHDTGAALAGANQNLRVVLRFDDKIATAVLDDTTVAREFAAGLPLTVRLSDPIGQAKSGRLPLSRSLETADTEPTFRTRVGELAYWAPNSTVAVIYDDLGQRIPAPGLVRLGFIDSGLTSIATAGNRFEVRIELVDEQSH